MTTPLRISPWISTPTSIVGPPTTGFHYKGEKSTDYNGKDWRCLEEGDPGLWEEWGGILGVGSGWVTVTNINIPDGVADNKIFQDSPANTVLQSCRISRPTIDVSIKSSYPKIIIEGTIVVGQPIETFLDQDAGGGFYSGTIQVTVTGTGSMDVIVKTPEENEGAPISVDLIFLAPPTLLSLTFAGSYPGPQTELKEGDTFQLAGTTDTAADAIEIIDYGACIGDIKTFTSGTSFTVIVSIANRGNSAQLLSARVKARNSLSGSYGPIRDTNEGGASIERVNVVKCNNLYPTVTIGSTTYPAGQSALKDAEAAYASNTVLNFNTILYSSPTGEIAIANPTVYETNKLIGRLGGTYNIDTNNFRITALRSANGTSTTSEAIVNIAHVDPIIQISTDTPRLRSGGNNGTSAQNHTIRLTSDQKLYEPPFLDHESGGGTWLGIGFIGGPYIWTRQLQIHDNDTKSTYTWIDLSAKNLAGKIVTLITGTSTYVIGGFVKRSLTFEAFDHTTILNTACIDYSKLQASFFSATGQAALRNAIQGNHSNIANTFTVDNILISPSTIYWNDDSAVHSNSSGTAQIIDLEEIE